MEQALLGGDQRPFAVHRDRSAFEDHAGGDALDSQVVEEQGADAVVGVEGRVLASPGVEPEVHARAAAAFVEDEQRGAVTEPRVVEGQFDDGDVVTAPGTGVLAAAGGATMVTGSNSATARATSAYSPFASGRTSPQRSARVGQAIRHPWCSDHSAGIRNDEVMTELISVVLSTPISTENSVSRKGVSTGWEEVERKGAEGQRK